MSDEKPGASESDPFHDFTVPEDADFTASTEPGDDETAEGADDAD